MFSPAWSVAALCVAVVTGQLVVDGQQRMLFVGRANESTQFHCFYLGSTPLSQSKMRCAAPEPPDKGLQRWPNVLGIGPAKSGSTATAALLHSLSRVTVADKNLVTHRDVPYAFEIDWYHHPTEMSQGPSSFAKYFANGNRIYFEKTPTYSADTLVPYRVRAFSHDIKLVFTTRSFIELDASLYFWRQCDSQKISYETWLSTREDAYEEWEACRTRIFRNILIPTDRRVDVDNLQDDAFFSWEESEKIESEIHRQCGEGRPEFGERDKRRAFFTDMLKEVFVVSSLKRWAHVFPSKNIFCLDSVNATLNPDLTQRRLFDFLGLYDEPTKEPVYNHVSPPVFDRLVTSQLQFVNPNATRHGLRGPQRTRSKTQKKRQKEHQRDRFRKAQDSVRSVVHGLQERLVAIARRHTRCQDVQAFQDVCGYYPQGYEFCLPGWTAHSPPPTPSPVRAPEPAVTPWWRRPWFGGKA